MNPIKQPPPKLAELLLQLLQNAPQGLSEYELIQQLKQQHELDMPLHDPLDLFRSHFQVFNALYQLRDQLWAQQSATLHISALNICLLPYQAGSAELSEQDPLRSYYLDAEQLQVTTEQDVQDLLQSFYSQQPNRSERHAALEVFEMTDDPQLRYSQIKLRYRQLVSQHHPDRGGSTTRLQAINKAMEVLERYYQGN
ncbi:DNA-J related domain-containing protein [Pseudomonas sp. 5P_3.1_Bac2]|uniref:DNA-J related domain-containing protein n=1 Tax=Pseudomonas sp. 5P_3.1_Bac2 TaxID=2971617 RepID=UPI0021C9C927|nr:DNA-J related domain-containing protein [Pseudomonas sp. 5P_3.1_Bac2]MCU1716243.1 molecular chaperone DnaJ [Pseudomonas sp. 5P_3.1_Bac2]